MGWELKVVKESSTGLNKLFMDMHTGETLSHLQVKQRINQSKYPAYECYYSVGTLIIRSIEESKALDKLIPNKELEIIFFNSPVIIFFQMHSLILLFTLFYYIIKINIQIKMSHKIS